MQVEKAERMMEASAEQDRSKLLVNVQRPLYQMRAGERLSERQSMHEQKSSVSELQSNGLFGSIPPGHPTAPPTHALAEIPANAHLTRTIARWHLLFAFSTHACSPQARRATSLCTAWVDVSSSHALSSQTLR